VVGEVIENIPLAEKRRLSVDDFLHRFAKLRRSGQLTDGLREKLTRVYM